MTLTQDRLKETLGNRPFRYFPQVNSTQDIALAWLRDGGDAGAAVIADEQLAGRGRYQRTWYTPPGVALAVSVLLRPTAEMLPQITMLGALVIAELADSLDAPHVTIKWPNDVRVQGRKISGVLPEAVWEGDHLVGVALGMGVNVRNDFQGTPLEATATSLEPALGVTLDRAVLVAELLRRVDYWLQRLGTPVLFDAWRARLDTLGQMVTINGITGTAENVEPDGALWVRDANGHMHRVLAGDLMTSSEES
ncbi:MAG: hypothetical protein OHK0046_05000 [Anaerolineae bacterium]